MNYDTFLQRLEDEHYICPHITSDVCIDCQACLECLDESGDGIDSSTFSKTQIKKLEAHYVDTLVCQQCCIDFLDNKPKQKKG